MAGTASCCCFHRCGRRSTVLPRVVQQQHTREQQYLKALQHDDKREGQRRVAEQQQQQHGMQLAEPPIFPDSTNAKCSSSAETPTPKNRFACRCSRCTHKFGAEGRLLCESAWREHWRARTAEIMRRWDERKRTRQVVVPAVSDQESGVAGGRREGHEEEDTDSSREWSCCVSEASSGDAIAQSLCGRNAGTSELSKNRTLLVTMLLNQLVGRLVPVVEALRQRGIMVAKRKREADNEAGGVVLEEVESPPPFKRGRIKTPPLPSLPTPPPPAQRSRRDCNDTLQLRVLDSSSSVSSSSLLKSQFASSTRSAASARVCVRCSATDDGRSAATVVNGASHSSATADLPSRYRSAMERSRAIAMHKADEAAAEASRDAPVAAAAPVVLERVRLVAGQEECGGCEAAGSVPCATCAASGLYVDPIMECQGIIVKVRCLGCGGSGSLLCPKCGGRGHK
ncbi:unnamed protein product [Closterium sp. NIES-64]|nr:unnamed protein product [Closterium sp. NIES-64]